MQEHRGARPRVARKASFEERQDLEKRKDCPRSERWLVSLFLKAARWRALGQAPPGHCADTEGEPAPRAYAPAGEAHARHARSHLPSNRNEQRNSVIKEHRAPSFQL